MCVIFSVTVKGINHESNLVAVSNDVKLIQKISLPTDRSNRMKVYLLCLMLTSQLGPLIMADLKTKVKSPKSVIEMIVLAIRNQPAVSPNGVSRPAIVKYLKSEFNFENSSKIKLALKNGVATGKLLQNGQSFRVNGDPVSDQPKKPSVDIQDEKLGNGDEASAGDTVVVSYEGKLDDGTIFDSASSFEFQLGVGDVIKGWDIGIVGIKIGGIRKLNVPSSLGYGKRGSAPEIPPNANLFFTVQLKSIK